MKKYRALMLDLDGTTIPNRLDGMPSKKVKEAIAIASKLLHVGVVTTRPFFVTEPITNALFLSGPSIVSGGAQIVDIQSGAILWAKTIPEKDLESIKIILNELDLTYSLNFRVGSSGFLKKPIAAEEAVSVSVPEISHQKAEILIKKIERFKDVLAQKVVGLEENTVWIQISHSQATKQHGIFEVAKILKIETQEIIGVGDGYNDVPLLMACGLKIAMGNAVEEIKEIADFIAPSVEDDGVAWVVEKFILNR